MLVTVRRYRQVLGTQGVFFIGHSFVFLVLIYFFLTDRVSEFVWFPWLIQRGTNHNLPHFVLQSPSHVTDLESQPTEEKFILFYVSILLTTNPQSLVASNPPFHGWNNIPTSANNAMLSVDHYQCWNARYMIREREGGSRAHILYGLYFACVEALYCLVGPIYGEVSSCLRRGTTRPRLCLL